MRRLAVLVVLALALWVPTAAQAHGGALLLSGSDGGYTVTVLGSASGTGVDLTAYPVRRDLGEPDPAARVSLRIDDGTRVRTAPAPLVGDGYQALVSGDAKALRTWTITATVVGPAGRSVVRGTAPATVESSWSPATLLPISAVALVLLGGLVVVVRRRRGELPA